jgi:two-component system cell cycle sensor histidine kinase/response regulator CckA
VPQTPAPGTYVFLEVKDSGCGISGEILRRIFEPFFTTKFAGRGLGLAATIGIARGHGGTIKVTSTPGLGTTCQVLLPRSDRPSVPAPLPRAPERWQGHGTLLVVDDEESVLFVARRILELSGFRVLTALDGRGAIELFREHAADIAGVLLDLTMPRLGGLEALAEIRRVSADVPVLLMSGYTREDVTSRFPDQLWAGFIQKPFRLNDLLMAVRLALNG